MKQIALKFGHLGFSSNSIFKRDLDVFVVWKYSTSSYTISIWFYSHENRTTLSLPATAAVQPFVNTASSYTYVTRVCGFSSALTRLNGRRGRSPRRDRKNKLLVGQEECKKSRVKKSKCMKIDKMRSYGHSSPNDSDDRTVTGRAQTSIYRTKYRGAQKSTSVLYCCCIARKWL